MKKLLVILCLITSCMFCELAMASVIDLQDTTVGLIINDEWASPDQPPIIENDRTLAPLRIVSEKLGFEVEWNNENRSITISKEDVTIIMHIGSKIITKNGDTIETDVAPTILNGRTIIPVRVVSELLGCNVEWHPEARMVFVDSPRAYAYYNSLNYKENTYDDSFTEISGYLGCYAIEPDYVVSAMPMEKYYIIPDGVCKVIADDSTGSKNTFINIKKIELSPSLNIDCQQFAGKRVIVKGTIRGVEPVANMMPFIMDVSSIEEDTNVFKEADYVSSFMEALNTPSIYSEEVKWAKLIDINKDGTNEMLVLDRTPSMNQADILLYSFTPYGAVKETIPVGVYSYSGMFSEGSVNMYEYDSYIVIENSINLVGTNAEGEEFPKSTSFNKFSIDAHGRINKEDYSITTYTESVNIIEIVPDYSYGVSDMKINEAFFDTKTEVEAQLKSN